MKTLKWSGDAIKLCDASYAPEIFLILSNESEYFRNFRDISENNK